MEKDLGLEARLSEVDLLAAVSKSIVAAACFQYVDVLGFQLCIRVLRINCEIFLFLAKSFCQD